MPKYEVEKVELIHRYDIVIYLKNGEKIEGDIDSLPHGGTIYGLAMNPRLYVDGDMEGKLELVDSKNAHYIYTPREDSDKKKIIDKLLNNEPVKLSELLPYGRWELWEIADIIWKHKKWVPIAFSIGTSILLTDGVQRDIYEKVKRGENIPMDTDVRSIGDLMYPVYYRRVENVEKWIITHLPTVALNTYRNGLLSFLHAKREERVLSLKDLSKEEKKVEEFLRIIRLAYPIPAMVTTKFDYVSLYIRHDEFVHGVTMALMDVLYKDKDVNFIRPEDREYLGDYKSHYFHYLKVIRGLEEREEYGVWDI